MKRVLLILLGLALFAGPKLSLAKEELSEEALKRAVVVPADENLVRDKVGQLERRISELEHDIRFLEDKLDNLERRIDDVRDKS